MGLGLIIRVLGLIGLAGIVAAVILLWRRVVRNPLFLPASKRKTGPLGKLRIASGVLGAALLAAVTFGTIQTVRQAYAPIPVLTGQMMRVPTRPANLEALGEDGLTAPLKLLVDLLVIDTRYHTPQPVYVKQFELLWPATGVAEATFRAGDTPCRFDLLINKLEVWQESTDGKIIPRLGATGHASLRWDGPWGMTYDTSRTVRWRETEPLWLGGPSTNEYLSSVLSVTPPTRAWYACIMMITPAAVNDRLKEVSIEQYAQTHPGLGIGNMRGSIWTSGSWARQGMPPGGLRLAHYLGMPALVLLAAAVLVSQVFCRRDLAFVGMALGIVLYVAAFDRLLVSYDLSRLLDSNQPLQARLIATGRLAGTFFYRHTATAGLSDVIRQEADKTPLLSTKMGEACADLEKGD